VTFLRQDEFFNDFSNGHFGVVSGVKMGMLDRD
jgi:hypothetical protein